MRRLAAALFALPSMLALPGVAGAEERNPLEAKFIVDAGWL